MDSKKKKEEVIGVPQIVEDCIHQIRERGLQEDGILRVSGSAAQIKELQNTYRKGKRADLSNVYIHTVGGVLKNYFRDMPKPVLTFEAYPDFLRCSTIEDLTERTLELRRLVAALPIENQELLHKILLFVSEVGKYSQDNQMPISNLATMFGPTFLRKKDQDRSELLQDLQDVIAVTHTMLSNDMFEGQGWPDNQDHHPLRIMNSLPPNKEDQKKVISALNSWYGSGAWEKDLKRRSSRRAPRLMHPEASPGDGSSNLHRRVMSQEVPPPHEWPDQKEAGGSPEISQPPFSDPVASSSPPSPQIYLEQASSSPQTRSHSPQTSQSFSGNPNQARFSCPAPASGSRISQAPGPAPFLPPAPSLVTSVPGPPGPTPAPLPILAAPAPAPPPGAGAVPGPKVVPPPLLVPPAGGAGSPSSLSPPGPIRSASPHSPAFIPGSGSQGMICPPSPVPPPLSPSTPTSMPPPPLSPIPPALPPTLPPA